MEREFLEGLKIEGLTKDHIDSIMNENGADINKAKKAGEDALNTIKANLEKQLEARAEIAPEDLGKLQEELTTVKTALSEKEEKLKSFDGVDIEKITGELSEAQSAIEKMSTEHSEKVNALAADALLRERLATEMFSSDYAKTGVYADLKKVVTYEPGEDGNLGNLVGYDEAITEIREKKPTAFVVDTGTSHSDKKDEGKKHKKQSSDEDDFVKGFNS